MSEPPPSPLERLDPSARWLWRLQGLLLVAGLGIAAAVLDLPAGLEAAVLVATLLIAVGAVPELRWRLWRFDVDDERLHLRRGGIVVRRTVVPIVRIQHVDSASDVLERLFGLATLTVHTAGGEVTVPGLREARAAALAQRIAALARADDD